MLSTRETFVLTLRKHLSAVRRNLNCVPTRLLCKRAAEETFINILLIFVACVLWSILRGNCARSTFDPRYKHRMILRIRRQRLLAGTVREVGGKNALWPSRSSIFSLRSFIQSWRIFSRELIFFPLSADIGVRSKYWTCCGRSCKNVAQSNDCCKL